MKTTNFYKLVFAVLFIMAVTPAFSQFSAGLELGIPTWSNPSFGGASVSTGVAPGVSVKYEAAISGVDKLSWVASAGYLSFSTKVSDSGQSTTFSTSVIPITGGVKYYFQESGSGFYGAADLGFFLLNTAANSDLGTPSSSSTKFGLGIGAGYRINSFDFSLRYNLPSDANYIALRAAYVFGGK
ncbi:MAG: outer membrane beta-barrel protein [Cyclobacteriaceae bacterium]